MFDFEEKKIINAWIDQGYFQRYRSAVLDKFMQFINGNTNGVITDMGTKNAILNVLSDIRFDVNHPDGNPFFNQQQSQKTLTIDKVCRLAKQYIHAY